MPFFINSVPSLNWGLSTFQEFLICVGSVSTSKSQFWLLHSDDMDILQQKLYKTLKFAWNRSSFIFHPLISPEDPSNEEKFWPLENGFLMMKSKKKGLISKSPQLPITIFKKDFLEFLVPFFYWMGLQDHVPPFFPFLQSPPPVWSMTQVKEHMKGNLLPHTYTLSRN